MSAKEQRRDTDTAGSKHVLPDVTGNQQVPSHTSSVHTARRATAAPDLLAPADLLQLQRNIGNRAVGRLLGATAPVQRLTSTDDFKQTTKLGVFAKRNKIVLVDTALDQYNQITLTPFPAKIVGIDAVINACDTYLGLPDKKAKRKPGTTQLHQAAQSEKTILERLRDNPAIGADVARLQDLRAIENLYHAAHKNGYQPEAGIFTHIQNGMRAIPISPTEATNLQQADLDTLVQISLDPQTPLILANTINEVLANVANTRIEDSTAGSDASFKPENGKDYRLKYGQYLGDAERLGTLVHEMTHISVGESYGNSKAFLSYAQTATIPEIIALNDRRTQWIEDLQTLLASDLTFSNPQRDKIRQQLNYPLSSDKILNYMTVMTNNGDRAAANKVYNVYQQIGDRLNLTMIEYDTVINQIMIYLHIWNIPQNNAFYVMLRNAAHEVYNQRINA